jgi:hypothetical protein
MVLKSGGTLQTWRLLRSDPAFAAASVAAASEALRSAASEGVRLAEAAFVA